MMPGLGRLQVTKLSARGQQGMAAPVEMVRTTTGITMTVSAATPAQPEK